MFECVTKVCRTQNSVSKTLVKAHQQNAYCDENVNTGRKEIEGSTTKADIGRNI